MGSPRCMWQSRGSSCNWRAGSRSDTSACPVPERRCSRGTGKPDRASKSRRLDSTVARCTASTWDSVYGHQCVQSRRGRRRRRIHPLRRRPRRLATFPSRRLGTPPIHRRSWRLWAAPRHRRARRLGAGPPEIRRWTAWVSSQRLPPGNNRRAPAGAAALWRSTRTRTLGHSPRLRPRRTLR